MKFAEMAKPLEQLREKLLDLHKAIIESERQRYEKAIGPIQSPNHFLQLLTTDPWFAWLHPLSNLIVTIDEVLEQKEPLTAAIADALAHQTRSLLIAEENAPDFSGHYFVSLQQEPDVVLAHAAVIKLIGRQVNKPRP